MQLWKFSLHFQDHPDDGYALAETCSWLYSIKQISNEVEQWYVRNNNFIVLLHRQHVSTYTGCPRRNRPNFGRVFLMLNYTDINQNTYVQSWTVTEIMAIEKCGHLAFPRSVRLQLCRALAVREQCGTHLCDGTSSAQRDKIAFHYCRYVQCLVTLRTTVTW